MLLGCTTGDSLCESLGQHHSHPRPHRWHRGADAEQILRESLGVLSRVVVDVGHGEVRGQDDVSHLGRGCEGEGEGEGEAEGEGEDEGKDEGEAQPMSLTPGIARQAEKEAPTRV